MHYYGVFKQLTTPYQRGVASLRDISNIIIMNSLLHNSLIYTACIIYKYDRFILYRTANIINTNNTITVQIYIKTI